MTLTTRRSFLAKCGAAGALLATGLRNAFSSSAPEPHIVFPTSARDRLAVATYPFRAYIESPNNSARDRKLPGMDLTDFIAQLRAKFNVHNVEPYFRHFRSLEPDYLASIRAALEKSAVNAVDMAVSNEASFYDADASARKKAIVFAEKWVDVAAAIGCPSIRVHIERAANSAPDVERSANSLREVTEYAAAKNIVINLENDDLVSEDAFFLVKVIEAVNNPFLRALPDFANSMLSGNADFNYRALQAMFAHAYCICHIKDGEAGDKGKHFDIDLKRSFDILKASGYRGYCSMEFDEPGDPYAATTALIEKTLRYLG
ncbi:MAG TPA: TIM barrel protein [Candidatus Sulfotelmatobacter sp.]|nr:TIM barrel protein [Candidatus Sulfotelmatobacter sp.]